MHRVYLCWMLIIEELATALEFISKTIKELCSRAAGLLQSEREKLLSRTEAHSRCKCQGDVRVGSQSVSICQTGATSCHTELWFYLKTTLGGKVFLFLLQSWTLLLWVDERYRCFHFQEGTKLRWRSLCCAQAQGLVSTMADHLLVWFVAFLNERLLLDQSFSNASPIKSIRGLSCLQKRSEWDKPKVYLASAGCKCEKPPPQSKLGPIREG